VKVWLNDAHMSLAAGSRIGRYEITSQIGVGGMGEVYSAIDTSLGREVAVKVLPDIFAEDPERLARFEREARTLASLNHPGIAIIHGIERTASVRALVMELVGGETLADRLARGAVPLDEALPIARGIAEALQAAHDQGIIHRDLKPANVKVRENGAVKVLDFGLAKALEPPTSAGGMSLSPTMTSPAMTSVGVILGTAAYMSPEQARGKFVDRRADIWALGVTLFEMLSGHQLFFGESVSDTLASVLKNEPDWSLLPADTPAAIRRLLRRCLAKDPLRRLASAADASLEIDEALNAPSAQVPDVGLRARYLWPVIVAALVGGALVGGLAMWLRMRPAATVAPVVARAEIRSMPPLAVFNADRGVALSPDGKLLAYRTAPSTVFGAFGSGGGAPWAIRRIDAIDDARLIPGVARGRSLFFSFDSRSIGFFDSTELKKVSVDGGTSTTICAYAGLPRGASWADDNTIVFATNDPESNRGLMRVSAGGGAPGVLTSLDAAHGEVGHWFPSVLPGRAGVLFTVVSGGADTAQVAVLDLRTNNRKTLVRGSHAEYMEPGYLVYVVDGSLRVMRFDLDRLQVHGDPITAVERVLVGQSGAAHYAVARPGVLVYVNSADQRSTASLLWMDRTGHETPINAPPRAYSDVAVSPDGLQAALTIGDQAASDLWIWHFGRQTLTPLPSSPAGLNTSASWTPDGRYLVFGSTRAGAPNVFIQRADGTAAANRLAVSNEPQVPTSITPTGLGIVASATTAKTARDVILMSFGSSAEGWSRLASAAPPQRPEVQPLLNTAGDEFGGVLSPNGRYFAYQSNEGGSLQVFVRPFPDVKADRTQVSTRGGVRPVWAVSGRELFYIADGNVLTRVPVQTSGATFVSGTPVPAFDTRRAVDGLIAYTSAPDGRLMVIKENTSSGGRPAAAPAIVLVSNWLEELTRLLPPN